MKIVSTGGTISTETYLARRRVARRKRQIFISASLLILLVLLVVISRLERFRIRDISVTGANVIGADAVITSAHEALSGYYFWLVPHNNALIYPGGELKKSLMTKFPRFSSVILSLNGLDHLAVSVVERKPFALYCGDALVSSEISSCYFLDESGFIFDLAPVFSDGVYFVYIRSMSTESPLGQEFLPTTEFESLVKFIENIKRLGFVPQALSLEGDEFKLVLSHGTIVLWRKDNDLTLTLSNLELFLASETIVSQTDFRQKVSELDLRTENKVFYRFRE